MVDLDRTNEQGDPQDASTMLGRRTLMINGLKLLGLATVTACTPDTPMIPPQDSTRNSSPVGFTSKEFNDLEEQLKQHNATVTPFVERYLGAISRYGVSVRPVDVLGIFRHKIYGVGGLGVSPSDPWKVYSFVDVGHPGDLSVSASSFFDVNNRLTNHLLVVNYYPSKDRTTSIPELAELLETGPDGRPTVPTDKLKDAIDIAYNLPDSRAENYGYVSDFFPGAFGYRAKGITSDNKRFEVESVPAANLRLWV
jgi:hypothetical protein